MSKSIAICGIRGIPARYGGFETFAEEISPRLVALGYRVRVYGRSHCITYPEKFYKGVELVKLPAVRHKYLETPLHTLFCIFHLLLHRVDAVLVCNAANSPFIWILRLAGIPVAVNVDGIERKRTKWNWLGRLWYRLGEKTSVWFASRVVADAKVIEDYYLKTHGVESEVIAYGHVEVYSDLVDSKVQNQDYGQIQGGIFQELGVRPGEYLLYVSRLEPENNALLVVEAFAQYLAAKPENTLNDNISLVIVGDAPYSAEYIAKVKEAAGQQVIFAGYRFEDDYYKLQLGALIYIQATEVGGTHPALVEAMGFGNCIIANDTPENAEVLAESGLLYEFNSAADLNNKFDLLLTNPQALQAYRREALQRARKNFSWEKIASDYKGLFELLTVSK